MSTAPRLQAKDEHLDGTYWKIYLLSGTVTVDPGTKIRSIQNMWLLNTCQDFLLICIQIYLL